MNGHRDVSQNKYAHLDHLSTDALYALLQADMESTADDDDEMVFRVLEILERREMESGRLSDVDGAWVKFQTRYHTEEGHGLELYPSHGSEGAETAEAPSTAMPARRPVRFTRILRSLVAAAVILLASMAVAQAAGFDVFGAIGRWTEETFRFSVPAGTGASDISSASPVEAENPYYETITQVLREFGIPEGLAPTWLPVGFEADQILTHSSQMSDELLGTFRNDSDLYFTVGISRYNRASDLGSAHFEKDDAPVKMYTSKERTFYIMSNIDSYTATWSDGSSLMVCFTGNILEEEIIAMIDSMGG
jgi:hypothetical protein